MNARAVLLWAMSTGVASVCVANEYGVCDGEMGHDRSTVDIFVTTQSMILCVRQMLQVSRPFTREKLLESQQPLMAYTAPPMVVVGPGNKGRPHV